MEHTDVRQYIAAEIRAEMGRQRKRPVDAARVLSKTRQAFSPQWHGETDYRGEELQAIAEWLGVDLPRLLPPGYTLKLTVVELRAPDKVAS